MPNYHPNAKSLVYGLSDYWTLYFKELPLLEEMYRGVEIDIGQVYLDLLALLLTTSVQDTPIFNKQYFQLVRIREDGVTYSSDKRYGVALDRDLADLSILNNKVFGVTAALERDVDFTFDAATRSTLFKHDPFSAYRSTTYGTGNSAFTLTTRVSEPLAGRLRFQLDDAGVHPPTLLREGYDFIVGYTQGFTTTNEILALINGDTEMRGLFRATLTDTSTGVGSPNMTGLLPLKRVATAPLEGYATRSYDVLFGTKFVDRNVARWLDLDVQKGDALRILRGPFYGAAQEFPIALVKDDRLILYPQVAPTDVSGGLEYVILRSPQDDQVVDEPFINTAAVTLPFDTNTTIDAATRTLTFGAPLALLPDVIVGDIAILSSAVNAGQYRIAAVIPFPYSWVVEGNPLVDEVGATTIISTSIGNVETDGVIGATVDGRATFSSVAGPFTPATVGLVLSVSQGGVITHYDIVEYVSSSLVYIAAPNGTAPAAGLTFGIKVYADVPNRVVYSAPEGWMLPGSVVVSARRLVDAQAVVEGRDYTVNVDLGTIRPLTVWQPSEKNTVSYRYRLAQHNTFVPLNVVYDGALAAGQISSPSINLTDADIGNTIRLSGCSIASNDGSYTITGRVGSTTALVSLMSPFTLPEPFSGTLQIELYARGSAVVTDVVEPVTEMGLWAPDAKVDKYHLYFTYGYLIDRIQRSSEAYRALIRGLFQLFMLGPTLERFESAINIVAALPVIRDDGEIFLDYESGALRMGTDGVFDAFSRTFTSASAAFVPADLRNRLYVKTGFNTNKIFNITSVVDATTVVLAETPTTNSGVSWELTATAEHAIVTSRDRYAYPRSAPLKAKFLDPANEGVLVLRAFEVVTAAFEVTDYVETPTWWESARIPQTLLPDYTPQRRQSTPALFENILNPGDGGSVGDPGYFVGADDEGDVIPEVILQSGLNGTIYGDPLYPSRETEVFFEAPTANFTAKDVGNYVKAAGQKFLIAAIVSPVRAKIVSYIPYTHTGYFADAWQLVTGTLPLRHTAAYVILDRLLKYHLFTVRFDAYLLEQLPANVIRDLQELVFVAKPTYTYLLLTPGLLFEELIRMTEDSIDVSSTLAPGGQAGELVLGNTNPLVIGPGWTVGSWYRYVENTSSFFAPLNPLPATLGAPGAGYQRRPSKVYVEPTDFLSATTFRPRGYDELVFTPGPVVGTQGELSLVAGEWIFQVDFIYAIPESEVLNYIEILAPSPNAGVYRIGRVYSINEAVLDATGLVPETNISWRALAAGSQIGRLSFTAQGESLFTDIAGSFTFDVTSPGTYIRRLYIATAGQDSYRVDEYINPTQVRVAKFGRMIPDGTSLEADVLTSTTVEVADMYFNDTMTYLDRLASDPATARQREYFIHFTSGANTGVRAKLMRYISPTVVEVDVSLITEFNVTFEPYYRDHYTGVAEDGAWENYRHVMYVDNEAGTPDAMTLPTDVVGGNVDFTSYGIQEPTFPLTVTYAPEDGDSYYAVGGVNPLLRFMRSRTALDADLIEMPVQIKAIPVTFDLTSSLSFSRSSVATYYTRAPTDGSTGFIATAPLNTLRIQNRGVRPAMFLEGIRTNICTQSRGISLGAFLAGVTVVTTPNVGSGVDGGAPADRSNVSLAGYSRNFSVGVTFQQHVATLFLRAQTGSVPYRYSFGEAVGPGTIAFQEGTLTTTWSEHRLYYYNGGGSPLFIPFDGRDFTAAGGGGTLAGDVRTDFMQIEAGAFGTSGIFTSGSTATRNNDFAYIVSASVPAWMRTAGVIMTIAPECTSGELVVAGVGMTLLSFGGSLNNRFVLEPSGGGGRAVVRVGGVVVAQSAVITFDRWTDLTLTFAAAAGTVTVAGALTGNGTTGGTPWVMPVGDLFIGNDSALVTPYFGEILPVVSPA